MIVLDASATIEWLLGRRGADVVGTRLSAPMASVHVPHLWAVEVAQVIRRFVIAGTISPDRGAESLSAVREMPATRYPHEPLLERAWQLRDNLTAYDAVYVALAEGLDAPLLTADARLASSSGHAAHVELLPT